MLALVPALLVSTSTPAASGWTFQGPAPAIAGQQWVIDPTNNPVTGAVNAIAASAVDPNLIYVGGANGGIWKTGDGGYHWTALSDALPSQTIAALALDHTDASDQTLIAGTSRYSGLAELGDDQAGIYYSTDGGASWVQSTGTGGNLATSYVITGVAASGDRLLVSKRSTGYTYGGIYRSGDGPQGTWTKLTGSAGLHDGPAAFVIADPEDPDLFYTGFMGENGGIYQSTDGGTNWTDITDGIPYTTADSTGFGISSLTKGMGAALYSDGTTRVLTVVLTGTNGNSASTDQVVAVYRSVDGGPFAALDSPGGLSSYKGRFPMTADRTDPDLVYVAGYGYNGGNGFIYRLDASQPSGSQATLIGEKPKVTMGTSNFTETTTDFYTWSITGLPTTPPFTILVDSEQMEVTRIDAHQTSSGTPYWYFHVTRGINGSTAVAHTTHPAVWALSGSGAAFPYGAPHCDYTALAVDAGGGLLAGSHGGLYLLFNPGSPASSNNTWVGLNGDLSVTEVHDVAYDHVSQTLVAGMQDLGAAMQSAPDHPVWNSVAGGDGGDVAVADIGGGQSARYASSQSLGGFTRSVHDASNTLVSSNSVSTSVISDKQFITPVVVNAVAPKRLVIGGAHHVYESLDQGATIAALPAAVGVNSSVGHYSNYKGPLVYGGRRDGVANPDLLYVGWDNDVYVRTEAGGALTKTAATPMPGSNVQNLAVDPDDYDTVFATNNEQVFVSTDGGANWTDVTGDLAANQLTGLAFVPGPEPYIALGSRAGVQASALSSLGSWAPLGDLPNFVVFDLAYDATDDVLVAGVLGRGTYLLRNASTALATDTTSLLPPVQGPAGERRDGALDQVTSWLGRIGEQLLSAVIPSAEADEFTQPPGLVSWWRANGDASDAIDGNDGTLESGTIFDIGRYGQAFSLDGVDDYVSIPGAENLYLPTDITIDAWVYPVSQVARYATIVSQELSSEDVNPPYVLRTVNSGIPRFEVPGVGGCSVMDSEAIPTGEWSHLAGTFSNSTVKLYVNGILKRSYTCSFSTSSANTEPFYIGVSSHLGYTLRNYFNGLIDEVHIFNRALTDEEIYAIYAPSAPAPAATVTGPASALDGQVVQFVLTATDPSPANQAAGFTYDIDWGDGSPIQSVDPVAGTGDATARHAFAGAGIYDVWITATNQGGAVSDPAGTSLQVDALADGKLQALIGTLPVVYFQPPDDAALQDELAVINALSDPGSPVDITLILGAGPYGSVLLGPAGNINLNLAGNYTQDSLVNTYPGDPDGPPEVSISAAATHLNAGGSGPAVTVTQGEAFVQGDVLTTAADAPTVLVTGGRLTLSQGNVQESTGADSIAIEVMGSGRVKLDFDMVLNINGEGTFTRSPDRTGIEPPKGIDAELVPNLFSKNGVPLSATFLSSTRLTSSANPAESGDPVTFTAVVDVDTKEGGQPTGTVDFYDGASLLGSGSVLRVDDRYQAAFTTSALVVGSHGITAYYEGDTAYLSSRSDALVQTVTEATGIDGGDGGDTLTGTAGDDTITGYGGRDTITTGDGNDQVVFTATGDFGDTILDFEVGSDVIQLGPLFSALEITSTDPIADGILLFSERRGDTYVQFDQDGPGGLRPKTMCKLVGVSAAEAAQLSNFLF